MNRDELKRFNELNLLSDRFEDIPTNHPMLKEMEEREEEDMRILEPDRKKVLEKLARMKSQRKCRQLKEYNEKAEEEFLIGDEKDYLNQRQLRKLGKKGAD